MFNKTSINVGRGGRRVIAIAGGSILALSLAASSEGALIYGVTEQNILLKWDSATPGTIQTGTAIVGLALNEQVQGIDFRPATGQMFLIGSQSNLYTVNLATGLATAVNGGVNNPLFPPLNGGNFGFDFNPVVDRIRLVSNADQNMRINPDTGAVAGADTPLAYAAGDPNFGLNPNVVDAAYTNNFAGAASTTLYAIDTGLDRLVTIGSLNGAVSPNTGQLFTVGQLGLDVLEDGGFDILSTGPGADTAYAALRESNSQVSKLYSINLGTGLATLIGEIGGGVNIRAMTIAPIPAPGAVALLACAAILIGRRRRRA